MVPKNNSGGWIGQRSNGEEKWEEPREKKKKGKLMACKRRTAANVYSYQQGRAHTPERAHRRERWKDGRETSWETPGDKKKRGGAKGLDSSSGVECAEPARVPEISPYDGGKHNKRVGREAATIRTENRTIGVANRPLKKTPNGRPRGRVMLSAGVAVLRARRQTQEERQKEC